MELEQKITQLKKLLDLDPNDETGYFMLGKLYLDNKQYTEGAEAFEKAIALNGDYSAAYRHAGDCYRLAEQTEKAREVYNKGIDVAQKRGDLQTAKEMQVYLRKL